MAVVVCAPHVDGLGKAAGSQLVVVVGDIGGKVGGNAVGADEYLVLGLLLSAVLGLFLFTVPYLAAYWALRYMIAPSSAL